MEVLYQNLMNLELTQVIMWAIGGTLIYLAIAKEMEPTLLLPMGFGAILVNLPVAVEGTGVQHVLDTLFSIGIEGAELFPLMLFIGIGAMIDFQPLLTNPKLMIFGAAAQFGIFFTLCMASVFFPEAKVAKSFTGTDYLENADAIISFCKLKSHGMMTMTAATKNLFGAVPGTMKPEYHFRFHNPMDFADMIIDLNEYFKPRLYLVDGIMGMEGNGPTAGTPRKIGAVLAAENCHKLDLVCAKLIGAEPMAVPTLKAAFDRGLCPQSAEEIAVQGELCPVEGFVLPPQNKSLQFENFLPGKLGVAFGKIAKKALQASPKLKEPDACIGCLRCARLCPAKAITMVKKKPKIDKKKCIRCFCCQEFCPKGALKVHRPLIARILNR